MPIISILVFLSVLLIELSKDKSVKFIKSNFAPNNLYIKNHHELLGKFDKF